ncbi:hypothetical protein EAW56_05670 [Corynebacterium gottingense]|uniref:Uncharacterized protein n=1 Tax=Corynebacterium gottingense TaxID=2041036 RepID=A0ABX9ULC6_9CORY|nr:hypothetical protein EAW56_05670 [Corynebacterium gottingense]
MPRLRRRTGPGVFVAEPRRHRRHQPGRAGARRCRQLRRRLAGAYRRPRFGDPGGSGAWRARRAGGRRRHRHPGARRRRGQW